MAVELDHIVPWGRTFREYEAMFDLSTADLSRGVMDCGGGPAGFVAQMAADGRRAVSVDPIYSYGGREIRSRFEATVDQVMSQVRATPDDWTWGYHRDAEELLANRRAALEAFLSDYEQGRADGRYVAGELPSLGFDSASFGLAVCSHLLFLYSDLLDEAFHIQSALELCRIADEVRIFPLLTLGRKPSGHLEAVRAAVAAAGWESRIVEVNYELQRGGNRMLRIFRV